MFNLPPQTVKDQHIPQNNFLTSSTKADIKREFREKIKVIKWLYSINETTTGIPKSGNIAQIQIMQINLLQKSIPKKALRLIEQASPAAKLYQLQYGSDICFAIAIKQDKQIQELLYSDWGQTLDFKFQGENLEQVLQGILSLFLNKHIPQERPFEEKVLIDKKIKTLEKEITILNNKVNKEKQINIQMDLYKALQSKIQELETLKKELNNG